VTMDTTTAIGWALYLAPTGVIESCESGIIADANLYSRVLLGASLEMAFEHWSGNGSAPAERGGGSWATAGSRSYWGDNFSIESTPWGSLRVRCHPMLEDGSKPTKTWYVCSDDLAEDHPFWLRFYEACVQARIWREYASSYDKVLLSLDYYRSCIDRHTRALTTHGCMNVVDIGGGTGNVAIPVAEAGRFVTVVDPGRAMLDRLRSKLSTEVASRVRIFEQAAEDVCHYAPAEVDGVNILMALFDMADPLKAFQQAMKFLIPGGIIIVTEPCQAFSMANLLAHVEADVRDHPDFARLEADWQRVRGVNQFLDPQLRRGERVWAERAHELLTRAGFRDVTLTPSHYGECATVSAVKSTA
jgi:ubiquinone/menaquinone biosynthesis C-methylase UbiE